MAEITWGIHRASWDAYLATCPEATFFHTSAWYAAAAASGRWRADAALVSFDGGRSALVPLAVGRAFRGLVRRAEAGLENGYGGLVAPQPLSASEVEEAFRLVRARYPDLVVTGNPHGHGAGMPTVGEPAWDGTRAVALRAPDDQLAGLTSMRARHLRAAQKAGFRLEVVEGPAEAEVARFYPLYAEHAAQWRYTRWVRDEAYFRAVLREGGEHLVLYMAWLGDRLAGFHLVAESGAAALQLHLATDPAFNKQNPGTLLVWAAFGHAQGRGFPAFDFLPSGRLESVQAFKESFGARPLPFMRVTHQGGLARLLSGAADQWRLARA